MLSALLFIILLLAVVFGPYVGIPLLYERFVNPHATVGEVGPWIILAYVIEIVLLLALAH